MSFTKPNDPAAAVNPAGYAAQAQPDKVDWDIVTAGSAGTGVVSGCAVTAQATPNMTVAVAAGTVAVTNAQAAVTAGNVTITAANATNPRIDLIVASSTGVLSAVAGTAAAVPCMPNVPASSVALAEVYVPVNATTVTAAMIRDCRVSIGAGLGYLVHHRHVDSGAHADYSVGTAFADIDSTNLTLTVAAQAGDVLFITCQASFTSAGSNAFYMTVSVNGTALGGTSGLSEGFGSGGYPNYLGLMKHYTVQAGDIVSGQVTVRPQAKGAAAGTIYGSNPPVQFSVDNIGPVG